MIGVPELLVVITILTMCGAPVAIALGIVMLARRDRRQRASAAVDGTDDTDALRVDESAPPTDRNQDH